MANNEQQIFGLSLKSWTASAKIKPSSEVKGDGVARVLYFGKNFKGLKNSDKNFVAAVKNYLVPWQLDAMSDSTNESFYYSGKSGPVWIFHPSNKESSADHYGLIARSDFARGRDLIGGIVSSALQQNLKTIVFEFVDSTEQEEQGALLGLELAAYSYSENRPNKPKAKRKLPQIVLRKDKTQLNNQSIREMSQLGVAMNISRHLTNVPGGQLNPQTFADAVKQLFKEAKNFKVEVWNAERLAKENMGLHLGVGKGAEAQPCLVHLKYRPSTKKARKPIAFVGKGVTFDTGGLDIKPSSAMRWMKKDMGGSAAVVGLAHWVAETHLEQPCDFYLALAENAISAGSFRPGDILTARNGLTIEIHNTDAEGRLVLADALDVAVTQSEKPEAVINLATLTGAIKVGLGADIAGLFCNDDSLSDRLLASAQRRGDLAWRMPLFQNYKSMFKSTFADFINASDGFGGAITAALFLQQFVRDVPWAHFDIYAWKDSAGGAFAESGGNGQSIQALTDFLTNWMNRTEA